MKALGFKDYLKKFSSRIIYLLAIVASAVIIAAYDHYYGTPGREAIIVLLGVLIGMVVIIFLEYLDHTLRTPNGVKFYAKMPFLGEVPPALRKEAAKDVIDKIVRIKPEDLMAEVFRNIRVNVLFSSTEEKPMDAIMVSSSVLSEGKTFVAANMAITFAQAHKGDNTLLIDGDMRRGELGEFFNIGGGKGLSEYLKGEASVDDIIYSTDIENFSVIPSGEHLDNPEELLKSEKLGELVKAAKGKFKRIIIDVPAIMDFEDIKHWGKVCDGLVYVIGSGYTPLEDVFEAKKKLEGKIDIAGGVLNHVAVETDFYYYWRYFQFYLQNKLWQMKQK